MVYQFVKKTFNNTYEDCFKKSTTITNIQQRKYETKNMTILEIVVKFETILYLVYIWFVNFFIESQNIQ